MTDTAEGPAPEIAAPPAEAPDEAPADDETTTPAFALIYVSEVTFHLPSPTPILALKESEVPYRVLEIPIALPEAQALGLAIHAMAGLRPSTHELFASALQEMGTEIVAVRITRFDNGVYYAEVDLVNAAGRYILDCRPTDAVILALRQKVSAPILCAVEVLAAQAVR